MPTSLAILGINDELLQVMQLEKKRKAPWCLDRESRHEPTTSRRKPPTSVKVKSIFSGRIREIRIEQPKQGGRQRYPLPDMQVGDYLFVRNSDGHTTTQTSNSLTSCIAHAKRKTGFKFKTRRSIGGVTVTRVS